MAQPAETLQGDAPAANTPAKDKKSSEPLFGPSIGSVSGGPSWTIGSEKKVVTDELTPEIISHWIEKSKEPSQPTTTLQALVNLKRPTLRLSPLLSVPDDPTTASVLDQHHHGLEFEYDCDAPKCGIYVHVFLSKNHPDAPTTSSHYPLCRILVFEHVVDGGFGNCLSLEEGALLELGRFENANGQRTAVVHAPLPEEPSAPADTAPADGDAGAHTSAARHSRRRFSHFHFRRRSQNRSISGPALAVLDAEPAHQEGKPKDSKEDIEDGVKVTIRLAALDEQGTELASPNEQITYLHVVRFGQKSTEVGDGEKPVEDTRPWVVRVVKREATIGPHTFHLHEIYGLTSSSVHNIPPTAPAPTNHTYPPDETQQHATTSNADEEDPQSECLLCLSSPREVVLLPCRHLVACRECALNMVEFGAGGTITQTVEPEDAPPAGAAAAGGGVNAPATPGTAATPAPVTPAANPRRKRKAKGWFCPVCRQPYTSMLRITTAAPPPAENKDGDVSGSEDEGAPSGPATDPPPPTTEIRSGGLLGGALRPGFFRGLGLSRNTPTPSDVESQAGTGRAGA